MFRYCIQASCGSYTNCIVYISIKKWDSFVVITADRYLLPIVSRVYMLGHTVVQTKSCFLYSSSHYLPVNVTKYNLIVITASGLDVFCVLTVHNILYKFDNTERDDLSFSLSLSLSQKSILLCFIKCFCWSLH